MRTRSEPYGAAFSVIAGRIFGSNESQLETFTHKFVVHPYESMRRWKNPLALLIRQISKKDYADFFILRCISDSCNANNRCNHRFLDFFRNLKILLIRRQM